jgi:hemerythrin-like domain-containing protein
MKRREELRGLSSDHHDALVLCFRAANAAKSGDEDAMRVEWDRMQQTRHDVLDRHFAIEEEHLFPALADLEESEMLERLTRDHALVRQLLIPSVLPSPAHLARLAEVLEAHIRFEERTVFETLQERIPAAVLSEISAATAARPRTCPSS